MAVCSSVLSEQRGHLLRVPRVLPQHPQPGQCTSLQILLFIQHQDLTIMSMTKAHEESTRNVVSGPRSRL